jgi:hypothetical protein
MTLQNRARYGYLIADTLMDNGEGRLDLESGFVIVVFF